MKSFGKFILPDYPMQVPAKDDDGSWVTGDPPKGINFPLDGKVRNVDNAKSIIKTASDVISREREAMKNKKD